MAVAETGTLFSGLRVTHKGELPPCLRNTNFKPLPDKHIIGPNDDHPETTLFLAAGYYHREFRQFSPQTGIAITVYCPEGPVVYIVEENYYIEGVPIIQTQVTTREAEKLMGNNPESQIDCYDIKLKLYNSHAVPEPKATLDFHAGRDGYWNYEVITPLFKSIIEAAGEEYDKNSDDYTLEEGGNA